MIERQLPLGVQLRDTASFESYYAGSNREVVAALRDLVHEPGAGMFIFGAAGTGKSHLMQAAVQAASRAGQSAALLDDESLRADGRAMLSGVEHVRLLAIDTPRQAWRDHASCVAMLRCLDHRRRERRPTLFTADAPPARLDCALPDLRTRLSALPVYGLRDLDDIHRANLLELRVRERGMELGRELSNFLLSRLPRDIPSLLAAIDRLDAASLSAKRRRLTVPFAQKVLSGFLPPATSRTAATRRRPASPEH